jgi:SAM-dependent methyltransferase
MPAKMKNNLSYNTDLKMKIVREYGFELNSHSIILDFGCGSGKYVKELRDHGYQAFGCDIKMKDEENVDTRFMLQSNILRSIDQKYYKLPFEDNIFDLVISDQVFEHVKNYSETISEIARVLKPDGLCLHIFPSRYSPIEPHTYIPLSTVIQSKLWINLWVFLGIRNEWSDCKSLKDRSNRYYYYLKDNTNYLTKNILNKEFKLFFKGVFFCEKAFLKYSRRGKYIYTAAKYLPFIFYIYRTFFSRVILTKNPIK